VREVDALAEVVRLEARIIGAEGVVFYVRLRSGELVTSQLEGSLELGPMARARIYLRGEWESARATLETSDDDRRIVGLIGDRRVDLQVPAGFRETLAVGFVRLGLWEVVFRLINGERLASGEELRRRLRLDPLAVVQPDPIRPDLSACLGHAFTIREGGRDTATATLWIDRFDGHAQERSQSARTGIPMMTTELYWDWRE